MSLEEEKPWIRGVNIGGWLVLERFITPYFFALTDCDINGDFHYYPSQIDAPPPTHPSYNLMTPQSNCQPIQPYPVDEWTLTSAFTTKELAQKYMDIHWDYFVTRQDIVTLKKNGVTHVRVPVGHWIMGDIRDDEPWVDGGWEYFARLSGWCREEGIEVWGDLHTAPGSQNGFDNSGHLLDKPTCDGWDQTNDTDKILSDNVIRTLKAVDDFTAAIARDNLTDVVTGFGVLNEPFADCDPTVVRKFDDLAFSIVKKNMGNDTAVYIGDLFNATKWNNGWWTDKGHENTFLDSHYYHVFDENPRHLSPRQHIALVCEHNHRDTVACCYENDTHTPSIGISRIIGEWSASFDTLVCDKLDVVMDGIAATGKAPEFDRVISPDRQDFLENFVKAQMVTFEAANVGVSRGWFYWTFKMEGGAFAEWDFIRGINEGWIPKIPSTNVSSTSLYGTFYDIMFQTMDEVSIVHEFPDATSLDPNNWQGIPITDDVVITHGESVARVERFEKTEREYTSSTSSSMVIASVALVIGVLLAKFLMMKRGQKKGYTKLVDSISV